MDMIADQTELPHPDLASAWATINAAESVQERLLGGVRAPHGPGATAPDCAAEPGAGEHAGTAGTVSPPDPRRLHLCAKGPGGDERSIRADLGPMRASVTAGHRQPTVLRVAQGVSGRNHSGATVDRLVHHAIIFEMNVECYQRREVLKAKRRWPAGENCDIKEHRGRPGIRQSVTHDDAGCVSRCDNQNRP